MPLQRPQRLLGANLPDAAEASLAQRIAHLSQANAESVSVCAISARRIKILSAVCQLEPRVYTEYYYVVYVLAERHQLVPDQPTEGHCLTL